MLPSTSRARCTWLLQMRGTISPANPWDVMVDLFFYREPEEAKDEEAPEEVTYPDAGYNATAALPAPGASAPCVFAAVAATASCH